MRPLVVCGMSLLMAVSGCGGRGRGALLEMVEIGGGSFEMGSSVGDPDEQPVHEVHVSSFLMAKYEVTQTQYHEVVGANPSHFQGENLPVEKVTWFDAVQFCNSLSRREGLTPCYDEARWTCDFSAEGYRLPTEAEWEYACRAGTTTEHFWGDADGNEFCWNLGNSGRQTHGAGTLRPNAWGLYDMSGNVWEWCNDWLGIDYYHVSPDRDPPGPLSGQFKVIRGGVWGSTLEYCRSANRSWSGPSRAYNTVGFRPVRRAALASQGRDPR